MTEHKPNSDAIEIPYGVKMTDDEIANGVAIKEITAILLSANAITQAIRDDVGKMFLQFLLEKVTFNTSLKTMMRKRGWIKVPPYFNSPAMPKRG